MMSKTKISIIVPIYNVEIYIKRCMDSLVSQTFHDYEIIAVNDGTLDKSMAYVYELQKKYDNIVICERENGGLSAARNTGIEKARGEYIMFCDSDDELQKNCLQMLYDEMESKNLDMLLYDAEYIFDGTQENNKRDNPYLRLDIDEKVFDGRSMLEELLKKESYVASACLYLIKRDVLIKNNLKFHEKILHEDELFTPIAIVSVKRIEHKNWLIYKRHVRKNSIMTSNNMDKRMKSLAIVIIKLTDFVNGKVKKVEEKEPFKLLISNHVKFFLVQTQIINKWDDELKKSREEIVNLVKKNNLQLGLKFKSYLLYLHLKKFFSAKRFEKQR